MEKIAPTTIPAKKGDPYILEDKDYLLITAINNLANEIKVMRNSNG